MVVAVINNFTTVPTIRGVFDANGLQNGTVVGIYDQVTNQNGSTWASRTPTVTLLNNEKLFYYISATSFHVDYNNGEPTPIYYARLFNQTGGVAIPNSTFSGSSNSSGSIQVEYLNNTGGTIVIRLQSYGTGGGNGSYFRTFTHGYSILNTTDLDKWDDVVTGSSTARHRKQYIENIYLFCPRYGTTVTVDGIKHSYSVDQTIKVIPVNNISTRLDYQGSGVILTALTGKGFNISA